MAPVKLKTYSKSKKSHLNGVDALNILFAKNLQAKNSKSANKRPKNKLQIKKLSKNIAHVFSDESSLHVNINDTFDKVQKGPIYNSVKYGDISYIPLVTQNNVRLDTLVKRYGMNSCSYAENQSTQSNPVACATTSDISNDTNSWFKKPTLSTERITNELVIEKIGSSKRKCFGKITKSLQNKSNLLRDSPIWLRSKSNLLNNEAISTNLDKKMEKSPIKDTNVGFNFDVFLNHSGKFASTPYCSPVIGKKCKINNINSKTERVAALSIFENEDIEYLHDFKGFSRDYVKSVSRSNRSYENGIHSINEFSMIENDSRSTSQMIKNSNTKSIDREELPLIQSLDISNLRNTYNEALDSFKDFFCKRRVIDNVTQRKRRNLHLKITTTVTANKIPKLNREIDTEEVKEKTEHPPLIQIEQNIVGREISQNKIASILVDTQSFYDSIDDLQTENSLNLSNLGNSNFKKNSVILDLNNFVNFSKYLMVNLTKINFNIQHSNGKVMEISISANTKNSDNENAKNEDAVVVKNINLPQNIIESFHSILQWNEEKNGIVRFFSPPCDLDNSIYTRSEVRQLESNTHTDLMQLSNDQRINLNTKEVTLLEPTINLSDEDMFADYQESSPNLNVDKEKIEINEEINNGNNTDQNDSDIVETSLVETKSSTFNPVGGKLWRRSLKLCKLKCNLEYVNNNNNNIRSDQSQKALLRRQSIYIIPVETSNRKTILQKYAETRLNSQNESLANSDVQIIDLPVELRPITARDIVLKQCKQNEPLAFDKLYSESLFENCRKIGEGTFGEVFSYSKCERLTVMKIVPIEGKMVINGEKQKTFEEVISEIVTSAELSNLRQNRTNNTSGFVQVEKICCVQGKYPKKLIELWDIYNTIQGSDNDSPKVFPNDQLYIVFHLEKAGQSLESFVFNNAMQIIPVIKQIACSLSVAEQQLEFEHRDLHWGNILLQKVDKNKTANCTFKGRIIENKTNGFQVTIIDFTVSRIKHNGVVIFNDLGQDPDLFIGHGDYQFDIYRLMKDRNNNNWQKFEPYSNILWLHYILDKSITELRYKNTKTKIHKKGIEKLRQLKDNILDFNSVSDFVDQYY